jgi:hypothetical protein
MLGQRLRICDDDIASMSHGVREGQERGRFVALRLGGLSHSATVT